MKNNSFYKKIILSILFLSIILLPLAINKSHQYFNSNKYLNNFEFEEFEILLKESLNDKSLNECQKKNIEIFLSNAKKDGKISVFEANNFKKQKKYNFIY